MIWMGYNIESFPDGSFTVRGDTPTEVVDKNLYKPGDVFVVDANGILRKTNDPSVLITEHKANKDEM